MPTSSSIRRYAAVTEPVLGTTGTGLDRLVACLYQDPGLAGANDGRDINTAATAADRLDRLIIEAAQATGAAADGVFTAAEVRAMNTYLRAHHLAEWTALHGDDEPGSETGYHLVQNDGGNLKFQGQSLLDTVIDGIYHLGFEIRGDRFLNEDGDANVCVQDVADWLTQFYTDRSTTGTGLDQLTDLIAFDGNLACKVPDADIAAAMDAANGMNRMLLDAITATGVARDGHLSEQDLATVADYLRADPQRAADWARLHGDDARGVETGFHLVHGDGAGIKIFGANAVNTVAEGVYDLGFGVRDGHVVNEDGAAGASLADVASWLNDLLFDRSTTGTGLDRMLDLVQMDPGLIRCTSAADIVAGVQAGDAMNQILVDLIIRTGAAADGWITAEEVRAMNGLIRSDPRLLEQWTALHGDDEAGLETGYHLVQNDGASTNFLGRNLANTVADGIYHLGFEICDGRLLNEDGDPNATLGDVATWLNYFYGNATIVMGDGGANTIVGDGRDEQINAGGGDDTVAAGAGDDLVYGSWGNDTLAGGDGDDLIYGGSGNDGLSGGAGDDTFRVTGVKSAGFEGHDAYDGGAGRDAIVAYGADVDIGVSAFGPADGIEVVDCSAVTGSARIVGDWRDNVLDFSGVTFLGNVTIDGGGGRDVIIGSAGNDRIEGGSWGDQTLAGGLGNDVIHGGTGNDQVSGGAGDDVFRVTGAKGAGFEGYDTYDGGEGRDAIVAEGANVDIGMATFGPANGLDVIDLSAVAGNARILGDWRDNVLDFSAVSFVGQATIDGGGGRDTIIGSAGDDRIEGGSWGDQTLAGGLGNDVIHGGTGNDQVSGGAGDDVFLVAGNKNTGFEGYDRYDGGEGRDAIVATGANVDIGMTSFGPADGIDVVDLSGVSGLGRVIGDWQDNVLDFSATTFVGRATIDGGGGCDTITGTSGNDMLLGNSGDDRLTALAGDDVLTGGSGRDVFAFGANWGHDVVTDFRDNVDKLDFRGSGATGMDRLTIAMAGADTVISFGGAQVVLTGFQANKLEQSDFIF